jgi:hypothetical protein
MSCVDGFSVKFGGAPEVTVINHYASGEQVELTYHLDDIDHLITLLAEAQMRIESAMDAAAEAADEGLRRGEGGGVAEREAGLEGVYDHRTRSSSNLPQPATDNIQDSGSAGRAYTACFWNRADGSCRLLWVTKEAEDAWHVEEVQDTPGGPVKRYVLPRSDWTRDPAQCKQHTAELDTPGKEFDPVL